jgi:hypothetical protein
VKSRQQNSVKSHALCCKSTTLNTHTSILYLIMSKLSLNALSPQKVSERAQRIFQQAQNAQSFVCEDCQTKLSDSISAVYKHISEECSGVLLRCGDCAAQIPRGFIEMHRSAHKIEAFARHIRKFEGRNSSLSVRRLEQCRDIEKRIQSFVDELKKEENDEKISNNNNDNNDSMNAVTTNQNQNNRNAPEITLTEGERESPEAFPLFQPPKIYSPIIHLGQQTPPNEDQECFVVDPPHISEFSRDLSPATLKRLSKEDEQQSHKDVQDRIERKRKRDLDLLKNSSFSVVKKKA